MMATFLICQGVAITVTTTPRCAQRERVDEHRSVGEIPGDQFGAPLRPARGGR